ncbi:MAG TPA: hypothetical protein VN247_07920, partial [Arenimonas sp.]|nr:hypothetical protein [Arenimonas sp.]
MITAKNASDEIEGLRFPFQLVNYISRWFELVVKTGALIFNGIALPFQYAALLWAEVDNCFR